MTDAERFQKAMQAILSVPPERAEEINRQTRLEYEKRKASEGHRTDTKARSNEVTRRQKSEVSTYLGRGGESGARSVGDHRKCN